MHFAESHFVMSHDAVPPDRPAEASEPSAAKRLRMSTSATLLAVAVCAILAKGHLLEAGSPSHNAAVAQNAGTAPVTIVAPEFCKDQTWPYIDSRCLRRVDNPPPADARQAIAPPATTAAATPVPVGVSANAVASPPANSEAVASTSTPPAAPAPSSPDTRAQDTRTQVIQSVFPSAEPAATRDNDVQRGNATAATNAPAYQRTSDDSQHRRSRHWNNHSGFFGFRF
jgi:hypothetical protein